MNIYLTVKEKINLNIPIGYKFATYKIHGMNEQSDIIFFVLL